MTGKLVKKTITRTEEYVEDKPLESDIDDAECDEACDESEGDADEADEPEKKPARRR